MSVRIMKIPITQDQWGDRCNKTVKALVIGYTGLNEHDGVLAVYMNKCPAKRSEITVVFASGDDGSWRDIWSCHKSWIKEIIELLNMIDKEQV